MTTNTGQNRAEAEAETKEAKTPVGSWISSHFASKQCSRELQKLPGAKGECQKTEGSVRKKKFSEKSNSECIAQACLAVKRDIVDTYFHASRAICHNRGKQCDFPISWRGKAGLKDSEAKSKSFAACVGRLPCTLRGGRRGRLDLFGWPALDRVIDGPALGGVY